MALAEELKIHKAHQNTQRNFIDLAWPDLIENAIRTARHNFSVFTLLGEANHLSLVDQIEAFKELLLNSYLAKRAEIEGHRLHERTRYPQYPVCRDRVPYRKGNLEGMHSKL